MNDRIRRALEDCSLKAQDMLGNLSSCYESLVKQELLPSDELPIIAAWRAEVEKLLD
jgi:hypothetical protein